MQVTKQDAKKIMQKLDAEPVKCKHHKAAFVVVDGVRVLKVHYSHGNGNMPPTVAHLFRKSLRMSVSEFEQFAGCTLSRTAYQDLLRERGIVPTDRQLAGK